MGYILSIGQRLCFLARFGREGGGFRDNIRNSTLRNVPRNPAGTACQYKRRVRGWMDAGSKAGMTICRALGLTQG